MPEALPWPNVRLGDICKVVRGGSPRPAGDPRYFGGDFIPWLTVAAITNVSSSQTVITEAVGFLTEAGSRRSRRFQPGMVVIANSGWKCGVAKVLGFECCGNDGIAALENLTAADPVFLTYWINSQTGRLRTQAAAGNEQPNLNTDRIASLSLPLPVMAEQRAIAAALSDAEGVVAGLERVVAKKRLIKQGAMQDLLTARRRLPGFSAEWELKRLGAALTVRHGRSQKEVEHPTGEYPILATGGQIGTATKFLSDKPSVLIGRKGTIDVPRFMDTPFWSVDTLFYTDVHPGYDAKFLFYVFLMIDWMSYNEASGVPSLNAKTIENIEVQIPRHDEQQAIAAVLSDMDAEIQALESRLTKARAVKEGMMQNLLTGRVRLV